VLHHPDLVRAGHRDEQERAVDREVHGEFNATVVARPSSRHVHCTPVPASVVTVLR
jgi:hypothetical protein